MAPTQHGPASSQVKIAELKARRDLVPFAVSHQDLQPSYRGHQGPATREGGQPGPMASKHPMPQGQNMEEPEEAGVLP